MDKDIISGVAVLKSQGGFSLHFSRYCACVTCQPLSCALLFLYVVSTAKSLHLTFKSHKKGKKGDIGISLHRTWIQADSLGSMVMDTWPFTQVEKEAGKSAIRTYRPKTVPTNITRFCCGYRHFLI